jgi:hypothetical protein
MSIKTALQSVEPEHQAAVEAALRREHERILRIMKEYQEQARNLTIDADELWESLREQIFR